MHVQCLVVTLRQIAGVGPGLQDRMGGPVSRALPAPSRMWQDLGPAFLAIVGLTLRKLGRIRLVSAPRALEARTAAWTG